MKKTWLAGLALVVLATALSAQQRGQQQQQPPPQRPVFRAAVELSQGTVLVVTAIALAPVVQTF